MNKIFLIGNLTRDPEAGKTPNNVNFCRFSLAVNRGYKNADGSTTTDFFDIAVWRGLGETVAKYCRKGSKVAVVGSLEINHYDDANGNRRTAVNITASEVEFLSSKAGMDKADPEYEATHRVPVKKPQYGQAQYGQRATQNGMQRAIGEAVSDLASRRIEPDDLTEEDIPF